MKKGYKRIIAGAMCIIMMTGMTGCGEKKSDKSPLNPDKPTNITIWNYYNGDQLTAFDELVSEFNSTVGVKKGIAVESVSQGSINNLADSILASANGEVGAADMPTLAAVYAETAYILDEKKILVNLDDYFTKDELSKYIPGFIEEGRMIENGELLLFPVSKSTECFAVNKTDWADFESATGIKIDDIDSYESLTEAAKSYYEWTDSLTPDIKEDGKALYGRDSVANYVYIGSMQLGHELFKVTKDGVTTDLDRDIFKTLWDNYYIPYINGYFMATPDGHRSEDMKTGSILALTGSSSGISYLPTAVTNENDESHDIEIVVENSLKFKEGDKVDVQQGAGYCVTKGTSAQQYAAVEFLKWFTEDERNLQFSVLSGYSPVTIESNSKENIEKEFENEEKTVKNNNILNALLVSSDTYINGKVYTTKPFNGSRDVRDILGDSLEKTAEDDRAKVEEAIRNGKSREEAVAEFSTDEYFDKWYTELCSEINKVIK